MGIVPAGAHLQGDRQGDGLDRCLQNSRGMDFIAHERGPGMAVDDLLHRTTEIDVDEGRTPILVQLGCL